MPRTTAVAQPVSPPAGEPPVEMTRLMDLTEGNADSTRELIDMFYKQTEQQLKQIEDAVRAGNAAEVGHVAHSCKGASATLGMKQFAAVMLQLEKLGKSGALGGAEPICAAARSEFKIIQDFSVGASGPGRNAAGHCQAMKKVLIIEDNQIVANVYRNKLAVEGYQAEIALDGETGLSLMQNVPARRGDP